MGRRALVINASPPPITSLDALDFTPKHPFSSSPRQRRRQSIGRECSPPLLLTYLRRIPVSSSLSNTGRGREDARVRGMGARWWRTSIRNVEVVRLERAREQA